MSALAEPRNPLISSNTTQLQVSKGYLGASMGSRKGSKKAAHGARVQTRRTKIPSLLEGRKRWHPRIVFGGLIPTMNLLNLNP
ncbi:hypothetical protein BDQ17DRAFT_630898 [Cyathus striatus]|nr:hypothetical protein BDQ17DRAFT_630898 [Cyathus striatus]